MKARLKVYCSISNLPQIRDFMRSNLREMEVVGKVSEQIVLAVDEACANAIIHQHNCDGFSSIELALFRDTEQLIIEIKDTGKAFPIDSFEPKSTEERIKCHQRGGMGVFLIKAIMDNIQIEQKKDYYIFRFVKNLNV